MKKTIFVICGTVFRRNLGDPSSSGSDISLEEICFELAKTNKVIVFSLFSSRLDEISMVTPNLSIIRVKDVLLEKELDKYFGVVRPDRLITQLIWSDRAMKYAKKNHIHSIYFLRSFGFKLDFSLKGEYAPTEILAVSKYAAKKFQNEYSRKAGVFYNLFSTFSYKQRTLSISEKFDILVFNLRPAKGSDIIIKLAINNPQWRFLCIRGWEDLKNKKNYDPELMKLMSDAHGEKDVLIPEEVDYSELPRNIKMMKPIRNPSKYYNVSKIVVFPSQWEEAFGRVIVESILFQKPVIASMIGGIPEAYSITNLKDKMIEKSLVKEAANIDEWQRKIEKALLRPVDFTVSNPQIIIKSDLRLLTG